MLSIVPIGTCRIHTPFTRAEASGGVEVLRARNYGFTHTAEEALQQLRYMRGETDFPAEVKPILFRPGSEEKLSKQNFVEPDLYVIEISSAKLITVDGVAVQMNYLKRHFNEFFFDAARTRNFWQLASLEGQEEKTAWLKQQAAFTRLDKEDQSLLRQMSLRRSSLPDLRNAMGEIAAIVGGDKVVFTTHVNAFNPDGKQIASRDALITAVVANAAELGVQVYNPTALMLAFEQRLAMENGGLDLTHFTDAFSDHLVADWDRTFLKGALTVEEGTAGADLLGDYRDLLTKNEIFEASRMLRTAARLNDADGLLKRELARLDYRLGNHEAVVQTLGKLDQNVVMDTDDQVSLLASHFELGAYKHASEIAERLLGDEVETPEIIRFAALAAERAGKFDAAKAHWQRLFYNGAFQDEAGTAIITLVTRSGHDNTTRREWAEKVLDKNPMHPAAHTLLWKLAIETDDVEEGLKLLDRSKKIGEEAAFAVAEACISHGWLAFGARVVASSPKTERTLLWSAEMASKWLRVGVKHLEERKLATAAQHIQGGWELSPRGNSAIRARRALEREFRIATRSAYAEREYAKILKLSSSAHSSFTEYPEMDAYAGRAAYASGEYTAAVKYLVRAVDDISPEVKLAQLLARAAIIVEQFSVALDALRGIIESSQATEKQVEASLRQIASLGGRVLKKARQLSGEGQYAEAHLLLEKAHIVDGIQDRIEREKTANLKALSKHIQELDGDNNEERFECGKLLFKLDPDSEFGAKNAAIGAMRSHRFEDAIEYFQLMRTLNSTNEHLDRNISKCKLFLKRAR